MNDVAITGGKRTRGRAPQRGAGPLVSIVTIVYNGAATIERTIQSVLAQQWLGIEYVIVDGGSTDGTIEIIKRYDDRIDFWCSARDNGIYDAMNKGVALCTGDWVGLINADDWYAPDAVQRAMAVADDATINIMHGDIMIHYPNGAQKVKCPRRNGFLLRYWEMVLNHPSFFVRRAYYADHAFDPAMRVGGDHQWTLRAWLETPTQFHYLPVVLAHFSAGGASMVIPLAKALKESDAMYRNLGMGSVHRLIGRLVKVALFLPQALKLRANQFLAPLPHTAPDE